MGSPDSHPDETPGETPEESSENENTNESDHPGEQSTGQGGGLPLSRRGALASLVGIGGLGLAGSSTAAPGSVLWKKDRDADGYKLFGLGTLAMQANQTEIASFEGNGLAIDGNGVLNVTVSDTRTDVSDDGGDTVQNVEDIDFRSNLDVTDDSDGSVSVDADTWDSRVDAGGNDIVQIGGLQTLDNKTKIKDFEGANLTIDSNVLDADTWDTDVDAGGNALTGAETVETNNVFVNNVGASVRGAGTVSGSAHVVQFSSKDFDHQNEFNLGDNQFVAADDGFYQVTARVRFSQFSTGESAQLRRAIESGGATSFTTVDLAERDSERTSPLFSDVIVSYSGVHQLDAGDAVSFRLNRSGGNDEFYNSEMEVHQVG